MLARVEQSHTEISLSCHITTSRTFIIVLPFNMAIIAHDSFVSISSKLCHTHTLLKKNVSGLFEKTSIFYSKYSSYSTCCTPPTFTHLSLENAQPFPIPFADTSENSNTYIHSEYKGDYILKWKKTKYRNNVSPVGSYLCCHKIYMHRKLVSSS